MGGMMSRNKGARVERTLVEFLRKLGWEDVARIPLVGSYKKTEGHCKPDVIGFCPEISRNVKFEVKARADTFNSVYGLLDANNKQALGIRANSLIAFIMSYNVNDLLTGDIEILNKNTQKKDLRVFNKINNMRKWVGESHILCIKGNNRPFIFIKYYD